MDDRGFIIPAGWGQAIRVAYDSTYGEGAYDRDLKAAGCRPAITRAVPSDRHGTVPRGAGDSQTDGPGTLDSQDCAPVRRS